MPSIRANYQLGVIDPSPAGRLGANADHAFTVMQQLAGASAHFQLKARVTASLFREHLEKCRLRDELSGEPELRGVYPGAQTSATMKFNEVDLDLRQPRELFTES